MLPHRFQRLWKIQLSNRIESSRVRVRNGSLFRGIISVIIRVNLGTQPLDVIHGIVTCGGFALLERLINAMQCNLDLARAYLPSRSWCPMHQSRAGGDQRCADHRGTCCPGPAQQRAAAASHIAFSRQNAIQSFDRCNERRTSPSEAPGMRPATSSILTGTNLRPSLHEPYRGLHSDDLPYLRARATRWPHCRSRCKRERERVLGTGARNLVGGSLVSSPRGWSSIDT